MTGISDTAVSPANAYDRSIRPVARQRRSAGNALSHEELAKLLKAQAYVSKMERRIERKRASGNARQAKRLMQRLYKSHYMTMVGAAKARKSTRSRTDKPALSELVNQVEAGISGPAIVHNIPKPSGGVRQIVAFDITDKARQIAAARSYGAAVAFHPNQFGVPGRGVAHAVKAISDLIKTGRYTHAQELDISNCFGSVRAEKLTETWGVPETIVREILTTRGKEERQEIRHSQRMRHAGPTETDRMHSLPQGAASSPLFAYGLLAPVIRTFDQLHGDEVAVINYCDNFLILGRSVAATRDAAKTLTRLLEEHPAARFVLARKMHVRPLSRGINFAGYRFVSQPGKPIVRASTDKLKSFKSAFARMVAEIKRPTGRIISSTASKISAAALYALHHLSKFRCAPEHHFKLSWWIVTLLKEYRNNHDVGRLFAHIDRKAASDAERQRNKLPAPAIALRPRPRPVPSITDRMLSVPKGFRTDRVIVDPSDRAARVAFARNVIARLRADGRLPPKMETAH